MSKDNKSIMMLNLADIHAGDNPRQEFDEVALSELMQSMKHQGLLSPVGVRRLPKGQYKLVFGGRRFLAAKRLGWDQIEAIEIDVTDEKDALIKTSTENVIRENISLPEQGRIFQVLISKGLTMDQIAVRMGCSKDLVRKALLSFNHIPKQFHDQITYGTRGQQHQEGTIPATVALAALDIKKENKLTDSQMGQLMEWAARHRVNNAKMRTAGDMMSKGVEPKKAMAQVEYMKTISISMTMKIADINKLQAKYKMTIHDIMYKRLQNDAEFDIIPVRFERMAKATPPELIRRKKKRLAR